MRENARHVDSNVASKNEIAPDRSRFERKSKLHELIRDLTEDELRLLREVVDARMKAIRKALFQKDLLEGRTDGVLGSDHAAIAMSRLMIRDLHREVENAIELHRSTGTAISLETVIVGEVGNFGYWVAKAGGGSRSFSTSPLAWMFHVLFRVGARPLGFTMPSGQSDEAVARAAVYLFREKLEEALSELTRAGRKPRGKVVMADGIVLSFLEKMNMPISRRYLRKILADDSIIDPAQIRN